MKLNPYLNFDGNAEEAFKFYQTVFGGELFLQRMNQAPGTESLPEDEKNRVMHVSIPIGDGQFLMASDCVPSMGHVLKVGNNNYISITPDSRKEADRLFNGLSAGGKVEMPIADMFWGDYFGSFEDKFGVRWMINFSNKENTYGLKEDMKTEAVH
jgi:PhnB protein